MKLFTVAILSLLALAHAKGKLTFPPGATGSDEFVEDVDERGNVIAYDGARAEILLAVDRDEPIHREFGLTQLDNLCLTSNNLAPQATPSGSGGGVNALGPQNMNDEQTSCAFYWPMSLPNGGTIQYMWSTAVSIDHFVIASDAFCPGVVPPPTGACSHESGRSVGSGDVEIWDSTNSQWVQYGSFANILGDRVMFQFASCVTTTALRVTNLRTSSCNTQINPKIYEWSVCECNQQVAPLDDLCLNLANVAPSATATSSGGGSGVFGVQNMNDESPFCMFHWPWSSQVTGGSGATIEYNWVSTQVITKFVVATDAYCGIQGNCQQAQGRGISQGSVEYLSNGQWVSVATFANNQGERIEFNFQQCITTTGLRVTDILTHACNGGFTGHPVVYEWAVCKCPLTVP